MDPVAALKELREISKRILKTGCPPSEAEDLAVRQAELFQALDGWILRGGFMPDDWAGRAGVVWSEA